MIKKSLFLVVLVLLSGWGGLVAQQTLQEEQDFRFAIELENKQLFDIAALQFERFAKLYPNSPQTPTALLRAGENYEKADSTASAAKAYLAILLQYPTSSVMDQAQYHQADLLAKNGEFLKAAVAFDRVKIITPASPLVPDAQVKAAQFYARAGEWQKSYDAAFYILENFPTHPNRLQAYMTIAEALEKKGDYTQALQYIDRLLGDRVEDDFAAGVYTKKSQLLRKLGRYAQADSVLHRLVDSASGPVVASAAVELARSLQEQRQLAEAQQLLEKALEKVQPADKKLLWQTLGDNYYLQGNYQTAKETYSQITDFSGGAGLLFYCLGMVNKQLGDNRAALRQFTEVLKDSTLDAGVEFYAAIEYARLLALDGRPVEGIRFLQNTMAGAPTSRGGMQGNELFFTIAQLQEKYLSDYAGARQNYSAVIAGSPKSSVLDDAQFNIARTYENEGNLKNALVEYSRYLQYYPGGDFYQSAQDKVDVLRLFAPADAQNLDRALNEILAQGLTADSRAEALYNLAQYQMSSFRDYNKALGLLERAANEDSDERLNDERLAFDQAYCHFVLYKKAVLDKQPETTDLQATELAAIAERLQENYPDSKMTAQVLVWSAQANLPNMAAEARLDYLTVLTDTLASDSLKQHVQLWLVEEKLAAPADSVQKTWRECSDILGEILAGEAAPKLQPEVLYQQARLLHQMARPDSAVLLLNQLVQANDSPRRVDALYLLASIYEGQNKLNDARRLYAELAEKYFYSPVAVRAEIKQIALMIKQGQYQEAQRRMAERALTGVPRALKIFYPAQVDDESLWLWAEISRQKRPANEAIQEYLTYLDLGKDVAHRAEALFAVGELAGLLNKQDMALGYWEECAAEFPDDSLGQRALVKTAELYFERGLYEKARERYATIQEKLTGDLQKLAAQQIIICDYRLGKLSRAQGLVQDFSKTFKDRNAEARFLYEEGMYYIDLKDFEKAEKALKNLAGKYDDVPEGARGDLGLARLYVVQTKTEDALKRLTEIPEKYTDPDIVSTAYLNLADFYYENRALNNTVLAGRKVLELQPNGPKRAQALDLLINAYDDLGMRDQALAYQREYIEMFPYSPTILDRRIRIGLFLTYLKEYDRAISELKELLPLVSADEEGRVQFLIAEAYAGAGLTEQAIIEYLKVRYQCKQHPKLPYGVTALYKAGEGYQKIGNLAKAKELFQIVVRERGATDDFGRAANRKIEEINARLKDS